MLTVFNVSSLAFITDSSEKELLRFSPSRNLNKNFNDYELLKRIFTEEIIVNPDAPTVTPIIQELIDMNPQPSTTDEVAEVIRAYPYKKISEIYDYNYIIWKKISTGTITETETEQYTFNNAGVQANGIMDLSKGFKINITVKILNDSQNRNFINIYQNLTTTSTAYPTITLAYSNKEFTLTRRIANNGTIQTATKYIAKQYPTNSIVNLDWYYFIDGRSFLDATMDEQNLSICGLESNSNIRPTNIRIAVGPAAENPGLTNIEIQKFKITTYDDILISTWNKPKEEFK